VCPAVAKTSDEEVVAAASKLVERVGAPALSMQAVAEQIGVRAPSLYKRFPDRAALLVAVERRALVDLARALTRASRSTSAAANLASMGRAYRRFGRSRPHLYALLYSGATRGDPAATQARRETAAPALRAFAALVGEDSALSATRVFTAFLHGFISMEIAGEFRLGPGIDEAFERGLRTLIGYDEGRAGRPLGERQEGSRRTDR